MKIYTKKGDDGTTGLFYGGRTAKDGPRPSAYGDVDEAQAALGVVRAQADAELAAIVLGTQRDLWVLMAELATAPENRAKLTPGANLVTADMVAALEQRVDAINELYTLPEEFVVPGQNRVAAQLDVARTVVRRAERLALAAAAKGSHVVPYLNRLSDLLWTMARWQEGESLPSRSAPAGPRSD